MLVKGLVEKNLRNSNRGLEEQRKTTFEHFKNVLVVKSGEEPDNSILYIGFSKTKTSPHLDKPAEGIFQISYERGKLNDQLMNTLHSVYVKSKCISMTDLCIRHGEEVWAVSIEIIPIQPNGDLLRLCVEGINYIIKELDLKTYFRPTVYTYASICGKLLVDPDEAELNNSEWRMTIVMKSVREILMVEKTGEGVDKEEVFNVLNDTLNRSVKQN